VTAQPHYATPRADWPTPLEAAQEPPTGPASPPEAQRALVAEVAALQEVGDVRPCNDCGQPATQQVANGHTRRGGRWFRRYLWLCDECAGVFQREWAEARRS
jgi:hypothetical protein